MEMRRAPLALILAASLALAGCGKTLSTEGRTYGTYGLLNSGSGKSAGICYAISAGNVIWSVILIESIVFPIYFVGFSLFDPVRLKTGPNDTCEVP